METVADFIFLGSKITAGGDCSNEIKICLLLGRKVMTGVQTCALPISWQIDWETVETVADFIFLGFKITADGDYSHEIKRHLCRRK